MHLILLKSKIHRATVTGASLDYEGSLTVSADLAEVIDLREYEKILVGNLTNGERFQTYVIYGEAGAGVIELNGATAHLGAIGDRLTIMSFAGYSADEAVKHQPRIIVLDERNRIIRSQNTEPTVKVSADKQDRDAVITATFGPRPDSLGLATAPSALTDLPPRQVR